MEEIKKGNQNKWNNHKKRVILRDNLKVAKEKQTKKQRYLKPHTESKKCKQRKRVTNRLIAEKAEIKV